MRFGGHNIQEPCPTLLPPWLVTSREVLPLPLPLGSDVLAPKDDRRLDLRTLAPLPLRGILRKKWVFLYDHLSQSLLSSKSRFPVSAFDWWSLSHMPALLRKGCWESES